MLSLRPKSTDPDLYRKELILNTILGFCFILLTLFLLLTIGHALSEFSYIGVFSFIVIASPILLAYFLSRKGKFLLASIILISLFSIGLIYCAYGWGIILPTFLLGVAFIGTCTSLLISSRAGFIYTLGATFLMITLNILDNIGIHAPDYSWALTDPHIADITEYSILILFISGVSWISNRQNELSLKRAHRSEDALAKERDSLEIRVLERTKELEQVQIEKVAEMYRFVEFGKLSAGLIHDLMSPLTSLCIEAEQHDFGKDIKNSGHANSIIDQNLGIKMPDKHTLYSIVQTSRKIQNIIHAAKNQIRMEFHSEKIYLLTIWEEVLLLHQNRIKRNNISLVKNISASMHIRGNPALLTHILTNLVSNALDAIEQKIKAIKSEQTTQDIHSSNKNKSNHSNNTHYKPRLEIHGIRKQNQIRLMVRDNGIGIDPGTERQIFDPFFTTKKLTGWGYGLSASKHMAEKYFKGSLELNRSSPNRQTPRASKSKQDLTSFTLTLPLTLPPTLPLA